MKLSQGKLVCMAMAVLVNNSRKKMAMAKEGATKRAKARPFFTFAKGEPWSQAKKMLDELNTFTAFRCFLELSSMKRN